MDKERINKLTVDKLDNSEDAEEFLRGLGLHVDEGVVRQVMSVLSGEAHESLYSLYATRPSMPPPLCGKGTVYKIKRLYDKGKLKPYSVYLSLWPTVCRAMDKQIEEAKKEAETEAVVEQKPYEETPHKQKMRELAGKVYGTVALPLAFSSALEKREPGIWFIGRSFLINISETREVEIPLEFEGHLYEGLFSHLRTGGFSAVLSNIADWKQKAPKIIVESHELLKMVKRDIEKRYHVSVPIDWPAQTGSNPPLLTGFTPVFLETICTRAIVGSTGFDTSYYKSKGYDLIFGGHSIYRGLPNEELASYRDTHIELIGKYAVDDLAKQIGKRVKELRGIEKNIEQQLQKFIDMERLPGWCELCQ